MGFTIDCGCSCCALPDQQPCTSKCCKCPTTGDLSFDILDCQAYQVVEDPFTLMETWEPVDSCCTGMLFTLQKNLGYLMCTQSGHTPSLVDDDGNSCLTTGDENSGRPTGTGTGVLQELWGFSGTVCDTCTTGPKRTDTTLPVMDDWHIPTWHQEECGGMRVKASLCCCEEPTSGFGTIGIGHGSQCGGDALLPDRSSNCRCASMCYKFTMGPAYCHELPYSVLCLPQTGTFMSVCSPCSFLEGPTNTGVIGGLPPLPSYTGCNWEGCYDSANSTGSSLGMWQVWDSCPPDVARGPSEAGGRTCGLEPYTGVASCSGQCPDSGLVKFMLLVEGVYESTCDCATGVHNLMCQDTQYFPSGVGYMSSVYVKFSGLLSDSS